MNLGEDSGDRIFCALCEATPVLKFRSKASRRDEGAPCVLCRLAPGLSSSKFMSFGNPAVGRATGRRVAYTRIWHTNLQLSREGAFVAVNSNSSSFLGSPGFGRAGLFA